MQVGDFAFDAASGELRGHDRVVRLEPQPAAILALLAARAGELVTHAELEAAIWGDDTHVSYREGLHYCIRQIRRTVGDSPRHATPLIETIPRRGYRLRAAVEMAPVQSASTVPSRIRPVSRVRGRAIWIGLAAALLVVVAIVERRPNRHHERTVAFLEAIHALVY